MVTNLLILTCEKDLHVAIIKHEIEHKYKHVKVYVLETDKISKFYSINWSNTDLTHTKITFPDKTFLKLSDISLIWLRRVSFLQEIVPNITEEAHKDLIHKSCWGVLKAALSLIPRHKWVSSLDATEKASDKLWQLVVARNNGLRVPDTIITNNVNQVREFYEKHHKKIIIKPYKATSLGVLLTQFADIDTLSDKQISVCPAIYQEYIAGTEHLRISCFGDTVLAAKIETEDLDWRPNLSVPISDYQLDHETEIKLIQVLQDLGLEMGIVDMKIDDKGELVWLEVNPQGQFLFLEPITKLNLTGTFANYLVSKATNNLAYSQE